MSRIGRAKIQYRTSVDFTVYETWKILNEFIVLQIPLNGSNAKFLEALHAVAQLYGVPHGILQVFIIILYEYVFQILQFFHRNSVFLPSTVSFPVVKGMTPVCRDSYIGSAGTVQYMHMQHR
jgi:hypothetical protein